MTLKGYRTVIVNAAAAALAAIEAALPVVMQVIGMPEWGDLLPKAWMPYYALSLALLNIWLRSITTTPIGQDQP